MTADELKNMSKNIYLLKHFEVIEKLCRKITPNPISKLRIFGLVPGNSHMSKSAFFPVALKVLENFHAQLRYSNRLYPSHFCLLVIHLIKTMISGDARDLIKQQKYTARHCRL